MATETVSASSADPGAKAVCALLERIRALPELVLPGFTGNEDDSTQYDLRRAGELVHEAISAKPTPEFSHALATFLMCTLHGHVPEPDEAWFAAWKDVTHG